MFQSDGDCATCPRVPPSQQETGVVRITGGTQGLPSDVEVCPLVHVTPPHPGEGLQGREKFNKTKVTFST
jgi:hypothetical protein